MAEAEAQLRDRLKSIVETEGTAVVEPSCLSDDPVPVLETAFRGACEPLPRSVPLQSEAPAKAMPKQWLLVLAGLVVGLILATVGFLACRKRPSGRRSTRRQARRPEAEEEEEEDDLEEDEEEVRPPVRVNTKPPAEARRPSPRMATRSDAETEEDPMFQPL